VTFSSTRRRLSDTTISLDVPGVLYGDAALTLQAMIFDVIIGGLPDELVVDLAEVTYLGADGTPGAGARLRPGNFSSPPRLPSACSDESSLRTARTTPATPRSRSPVGNYVSDNLGNYVSDNRLNLGNY
jgi:hypothetical protein